MNRLRRESMYGKILITSASIVLAAFSMGFVFLAPVVAYKYLKKDKGYEAVAQIPAEPEEVYNTAVGMAEEKAPNVKILKKEDDNMFLEVTDGVQTASLRVRKAEEGKSEFTVLATVPKEEGQDKEMQKNREKELAHRIVNSMCTKMQLECSLIKE